MLNKVEIDSESCKSCGFCIKFCPRKVLAVGQQVNSKGYEYTVVQNPTDCTSCRFCGIICPDGAIEVYR